MAMNYAALMERLVRDEFTPSPNARPSNFPDQYPLRVSEGVIRSVHDRGLWTIEEPVVLERDARGDAIVTRDQHQSYEIHAGDDNSTALLARRCVWACEAQQRVRLTWFGVNGQKILRDFEVIEKEPE